MQFRALFCVLLAFTGCDGSSSPDAGMGDGGMDGGRESDAGRDAGPRWIGPGCNLSDGIECDGDWTDECDPECDADECCAPLWASSTTRSEHVCIARGADGSCPAADLYVDEDQIVNETTGEDFTTVQWQFFAPDDCAIAEGCVGGAGWRRLLRFATWTPNQGTADMYLGRPNDSNPYFEYSECHDHYHFNGYAEYELRETDGSVAAVGHKQAFCLLDFYQYPGTSEEGVHYDCGNQGIQAGYQDVYDENLDCQWIDVTDVPEGDYTLHIELNVDHVLLESNYENNVADIPVSIGADTPVDVTDPCPRVQYGFRRDCDLIRVQADPYTCTPGAAVRVGCSAACGLGACAGDSVLRACDPALMSPAEPNDCARMAVLATNDDAYCDGDDYCSLIEFTCPAGGQYVLYQGGYDSSDPSTGCTQVAVDPSP
jgi:hypothetical protein